LGTQKQIKSILFHDHSLSPHGYPKKKRDMGYAKINKRHAQESMRKNFGHMRSQIKREKERKRKIAHIQEKENGEGWSMKRSSYTIHQKYPCTCTS
jgi:hypothetical protein